MILTVEQIAKVCHETNRAYCAGLGDHSQLPWESCPQWQKDSAIKGVQFRLDNPEAESSAQHNAWLADKRTDGWMYGPVKDPVKKEHPCFVPYEQLPIEQRIKDSLFQSVVDSIAFPA